MKTLIAVAAALLLVGGAAAQGRAPAPGQPAPAQGAQAPLAPPQQMQPAQQGQKTAAVVVHLTEFGSDLHRVQMALSTASALQARGTPVTLLLDVNGVHLADRGTPLDMAQLHVGGGLTVAQGQGAPQDEIQPVVGGGSTANTLESLYQQFVSGGGQVIVRQHCASMAGIDRGALRQGARLVNDREIADVLAGANRVIDY